MKFIFITTIMMSSLQNWAASFIPKKILTISPKFAQQKGKYLKKELEQRASQGYFLNFGVPREQEETYAIMARNFKLNNNEVSTYIQRLNDIAQDASSSKAGSGDGTGGSGSASGGRGNNSGGSGSGSGFGVGGLGDGSGSDQIGNNKGEKGEKGDRGPHEGGKSSHTSKEEKQEQQKEENTEIESLPDLVDEEEKVEEKKEEKKIVLKPFEYTLEPLTNFNSLSKEEKEQSDECIMSILLRFMQISFDAQHTSLKAEWIDELGKIGEIPNGYFAIKPTLGMSMMVMPKPKNGFEAYYYIMKEQLIAFVGLVDTFKKRKELQDLLGSESADGTLKQFIDKQLQGASFDDLYKKLMDEKQLLLKEWIKLFEPCLFDSDWTKNTHNQRVMETILINIIVSKKNIGNEGLSLQIVSDNEVKVVLLSLLEKMLSLNTDKQSFIDVPGESLQEEDQEQSIVKNKEETKKLLEKFLANKIKVPEKIVTPSQEQKKRDIVILSTDYVLGLYDQFNRLRVNSHFEKMFAIIGSKALVLYNKDQTPLKNYRYPLLLWLFDRERIKSATTFREMVKNQLFFNKEDSDIKTIFADLTPWNIVFDFHNFESKKYKKKVDVIAYVNNELKGQSSINGVRALVQRLRSLVVEQSLSKIKGLEELLKGLDVKVDSVLDLFEDIIRNENTSSNLDGAAKIKLKKIITDYVVANKKTVAIINYLKRMKELYEKTKQPITKQLYDEFDKENKEYKYMSQFQIRPLFFGLYRMPATLYSQFVKIAGKKQLVADIVSQDDFYNYVVPYGMLLKVIEEAQSNLVMLRNSLLGMNSGIIKAQELYADVIKNSDNRTIIQKGVYKDKLQNLLDAISQGDPVKAVQAIDAFVEADGINLTQSTEYKNLISNFVTNFSTQTMLYYSIMMKVLNEGSAECPENAQECLIEGLPLEGSDIPQKNKVRNAYIYKKMTGLLAKVSMLLNPNNKPLTAQEFVNLNIDIFKKEIEDSLELIRTALQDKKFDRYWIDQRNKDTERAGVIEIIENHFRKVIVAIEQLKSSIGSSGSSTQVQVQTTNDHISTPPPPPPPPGMITSEMDSGPVPPPPPPPPGF